MYRVTPGQILVVEKIDGEGEVLLQEVLMVSDEAGTVFAQGEKSIGVSVRAKILSQERDQKIIVFKKEKAQELPPEAGSPPISLKNPDRGNYSGRIIPDRGVFSFKNRLLKEFCHGT
ncbi:50S ribosomal protein L21 [mine drainage metagenome]|uniref:50S ribosomal protein L21 n=1 Tax=mine drainage metagenome TaxID=410659 RepID=T1BK10_9ZZZZ